MKFEHLMEAKFSRPVIAYHGTRIENLRSILKQGLITDSTGTGFGSNVRGSFHGRDMGAVGGVYFSTSAQYAGHVAKAEWGGSNYLIVEASLQPRSGGLDEDDIETKISRIILPDLFYGAKGTIRHYASFITDRTFRHRLVDHLKNQIPELANERNDRLENLIEAAIVRRVVYVKKSDYLEHFITNTVTYDIAEQAYSNLPSPQEAERNYKVALDWVTRAMISQTPTFQTDFGASGESFRISESVTYRGNNRITGVFEIDEGIEAITVHYGDSSMLFRSNFYSNYGETIDF